MVGRLGAGLEIAFLVEDLVVRQAALAVRGAQRAGFDERGGVEDLPVGAVMSEEAEMRDDDSEEARANQDEP